MNYKMIVRLYTDYNINNEITKIILKYHPDTYKLMLESIYKCDIKFSLSNSDYNPLFIIIDMIKIITKEEFE